MQGNWHPMHPPSLSLSHACRHGEAPAPPSALSPAPPPACEKECLLCLPLCDQRLSPPAALTQLDAKCRAPGRIALQAAMEGQPQAPDVAAPPREVGVIAVHYFGRTEPSSSPLKPVLDCWASPMPHCPVCMVPHGAEDEESRPDQCSVSLQETRYGVYKENSGALRLRSLLISPGARTNVGVLPDERTS